MSQPSFESELESPDFEMANDAFETGPQAESAPAAPPAPRYRKQGFSIYTFMLIISFICLLTALIVLLIEAGKYT